MIKSLRNLLAAHRRAGALDRLLTDRLARAVPVEDYLLDAARGKAPLPDREKCRQLAYQLGVPTRQHMQAAGLRPFDPAKDLHGGDK